MLKAALVGCGRIAKKHFSILHNSGIEGVRLVAVCDIDQGKAESLASGTEVRTYSDYGKMMEKEEVDLVAVLTPSGLHAKHVIDLSSYGAHIVVEKPMALTLADADKMIEACKRAKVKLFVVKQNRFNLPVTYAKGLVDANALGELTVGAIRVRWCRRQEYYDQAEWRGTWALDGGVLANQASHHIDLLQYFFGPVESVHAFTSNALVDVETEDTAVASLRFLNGALGTIEATTAARPTDLEGSISVLGEKGVIEIGGFAVNELKRVHITDEQPMEESELRRHSQRPDSVYGFGHRPYYEEVFRCLNGETVSEINGEEGRKSLEIIVGMYQSAHTGKTVRFPLASTQSRLGGSDQ